MKLPVGMQLHHRYRILSLLGQGGFGITYLCHDMETGEKRAVKEFFPQESAIRCANAETPYDLIPLNEDKQDTLLRGLDLFFEEVRILMEFNHHANLVQITDYFFENQTAYFVMNYIEGVSLREHIEKKGGRISLAEAWRLLHPVMRALSAVHGAGLLHRDIAPDNILITKAGDAILLDFGSARHSLSGSAAGASLTIKPGYTPIEQYIAPEQQGAWTDVYQIGAVFYRAITGIIPDDSLERAKQDHLPSPAQMGITLPILADRAIMKALSLQPEARYSSMQAMMNDLERISPLQPFIPPIAQKHVFAYEAQSTVYLAPKKQRKIADILFAIFVLFVLGIIIIIMIKGGSPFFSASQ